MAYSIPAPKLPRQPLPDYQLRISSKTTAKAVAVNSVDLGDLARRGADFRALTGPKLLLSICIRGGFWLLHPAARQRDLRPSLPGNGLAAYQIVQRIGHDRQCKLRRLDAVTFAMRDPNHSPIARARHHARFDIAALHQFDRPIHPPPARFAGNAGACAQGANGQRPG